MKGTIFLGLMLWAGLATPTLPQAEAPVKVVVNAANPVSSMSSPRVASLFLKRTTRWPGGEKVEPVDQTAGSSARERFSSEILDRDVAWVESYWNKMVFSGRASPPPELGSDAAVLDYVRANLWAVGYVTGDVTLGDGLKLLELAD